MTRRNLAGAAAIISYYIASVLGHLEVSLWLVQQRESALLGSYRLADFLPYAVGLLLIVIVLWQTRRALRGYNHARTLAAWAAWCAAVALADRFLIYSFPEYLHYPQYALLAWMLARLHDPDRTTFAVGPVLLAVCVLGIADEALQYTWITTSYSNYLDFNDFLLNLLGAAAGLLLYYGYAPGSPSHHPENDQGVGRLGPKAVSQRSRPRRSVGLRFASPTYETDSRLKPGTTAIKAPARYGLVGFAWLGTAMLLAIAAIKVTSTDPDLLQPIERQPSYNTWIPGPHAGRYYVLGPVTGTLLLTGLGVVISATTTSRPRRRRGLTGFGFGLWPTGFADPRRNGDDRSCRNDERAQNDAWPGIRVH